MERTYEICGFGSVFAVPSAVVDKHIKLCGGVSLKVLLMLLRSPDAPPCVEEMAARLGMSTGDIADALNYWVEAGILTSTNADIPPEHSPETDMTILKQHTVKETPDNYAAPDPHKPLEDEAKPISHKTIGRPRMPRREMLGIIEQSGTLKGLMDAIQAVLGKPLTSTDMDAVVALYTYYGLSAHYIMTVAQYCDAIGKLNMRYIEKTAASWQDDGVTADNVDDHVSKLLLYRSKEGVVRRLLGIYDRALSAGEQKYIESWCGSLGFEPELIGAAYDITVMQTGKLAFAYMNKILTTWHKKGISTAEAALGEHESGKPAPSVFKTGKPQRPMPGNKQVFDAARLEKLIESRLQEDGESP